MKSQNLIVELNTFANIIIHSRKQVLLLWMSVQIIACLPLKLNTIYIVLKAQIDNRNLLKTIPYTWRSKKHKENRKLRLFSFCWQSACGVRLLSCFARICIYTFRIAYAFIQWLTTSDSSQRGNKHKKCNAKFQKSFRGFYRERLRNRESIGAFLFLSAKCSADGTDEFSAVSWILSGVRRYGYMGWEDHSTCKEQGTKTFYNRKWNSAKAVLTNKITLPF